MRTYITLSILLLFATVSNINAQVTVGSGTPPISGSILQLKERESTATDFTTADRGFSFPRVALSKTNELYPMYAQGYPGISDIAAEKKENTGLVVYNVTENDKVNPTTDVFLRGLYIWDGAGWNLLQSNKVIEPAIDEIICGSATLNPASYQFGVAYKGILSVPYSGGNGGFYEDVTPVTVNGLTFTPQPGQLSIGNGELFYTVEGTPSVSSPEMTNIPIDFLGKSCIASVGNTQEIKTINFAKTVAENFTTDNIASKTTTNLGNLAVRIEYVRTTNFPANYSYFLTFKVSVPNHVTVLYTKSGSSVGYMLTGKKAAQDITLWYRIKNTAYFDEPLILDESASGGPGGNKDDLNPANRDIVQAVIMLHNTTEVYRVTINANGAINASGTIPAVVPTVTLFLEKLD